MKLTPLELRGAESLISDLLSTKVEVKSPQSTYSYEVYPDEGYRTEIDGVPVEIVLREYAGGEGQLRAVVKYGDIHIMLTGYTSDRYDSWGQGYNSDSWDGKAHVVEYKEVVRKEWVPV